MMTKEFTPFEVIPGSDHEVEAYQYLTLLSNEVRARITFEDFLTVKRIVTSWQTNSNPN